MRRIKLGLIIPVGIMLFLLVGGFMIYRPRRSELVTLAQEVIHAEESLTYVMEHGAELKLASGYLPRPLGTEGDGDQRFLLQVSQKLRDLGLTPRAIQPKGEKRDGEYMRRTYLLDLQGTYPALVKLLRYFEELPELVLIGQLDVKSSMLTMGGSEEHVAIIELTFIGH